MHFSQYLANKLSNSRIRLLSIICPNIEIEKPIDYEQTNHLLVCAFFPE